MYSYLESSLPLSLVEAARIDGSGEFTTFNRIVLPIMKPAVAVQAIFSFVGSWNNYFVPALIIQSKDKMTVPRGLFWGPEDKSIRPPPTPSKKSLIYKGFSAPKA